ncbi:hypothetical protein D3C75_781030 [compost metagenome]
MALAWACCAALAPILTAVYAASAAALAPTRSRALVSCSMYLSHACVPAPLALLVASCDAASLPLLADKSCVCLLTDCRRSA